MNENIITIYDQNNNPEQYKILLIIEKKYKYIIYTDIKNRNIKNNLYAIKVSSLKELKPLKINDSEWQMIEKEYNNSINNSHYI